MPTTASDRDGRHWAISADADGHLCARSIPEDGTSITADLGDVIATYGPLVLASTRPAPHSGCTSFVDTVDLVASDPATASIDQIAAVATFARSIVLPAEQRA